MSEVALRPQGLDEALAERRHELRSPEVVMAPRQLGAARLTRYSFSRTLLRRAAREGWQARLVELDMDAEGRGHAIYRTEAGDRVFDFVAFTTTVDESLHTDRVIAEAWEVCGALVDGAVDADYLEVLRREVPRQEDARLDPRVLVLTRGNRSVRFFGYLVDRLAAGLQPEADKVADAGYILRSTAFYGNGKFGMRSYLGYPEGHPLRSPYRAQFLCAWMFRELGYDQVEHCARARGGDRAARFAGDWRRYFGLGNATGLGLVPYAFKHPRVLNAWAGVRELALANVRSLPATPKRLDALRRWVDRAVVHFETIGGDDRPPWLGPTALAGCARRVRARIDEVAGDPAPFDTLFRWAEDEDVETCELVVSLLVELDEGLDDDQVDHFLRVDEEVVVDPLTTAADLRSLLGERYAWLDGLDLEGDGHYWWVISDNSDEPRRVVRSALDPDNHDVAIDVARRLHALGRCLDDLPDDAAVGTLLAEAPHHASAVRRLLGGGQLYGEPRDDACAAGYLPLEAQRFQLAMYGMDNYSPKSTDWLRVTLFQGAPRCDDLGPETTDDWVWPPRPTEASA